VSPRKIEPSPKTERNADPKIATLSRHSHAGHTSHTHTHTVHNKPLPPIPSKEQQEKEIRENIARQILKYEEELRKKADLNKKVEEGKREKDTIARELGPVPPITDRDAYKAYMIRKYELQKKKWQH